MVQFIVFLHVLGAIGIGFYLMLPFISAKLSGLSGSAQEGLTRGLFKGNRIAQYLMIIQFLTGGYLISQGDYTPAWMIVVLVLFIGAAALAGIMSKPMKNLIEHAKAGQSTEADSKKIQNFSSIVAVLLGIIVILMMYPTII